MGIKGFIENNLYVQFFMHPIKTTNHIKNAITIAGNFKEVFAEQGYRWLFDRIKPGTTLIDIGGTTGDTAIYFSMSQNTKKIISFEASPRFSRAAKEIIAMSPNREKIEFNNIAVTSDGLPRVFNTRTSGSDFARNPKMGFGEKVNAATLKSIIEKATATGAKNIAIKCDCEGEESRIFNDANLENVYAMQIECHNGCKPLLSKKLEDNGFKITVLSASPDEQSAIIGAERMPDR